MLETSRLWAVVFVALLAGCATEPPQSAAPPATPPVVAKPVVDEKARAEEARAMLAQAETDIQRARAKRGLWLKAWEELIAARQAVAMNEHESAIRHSKRASELAQLGLEQLAFPAVK